MNADATFKRAEERAEKGTFSLGRSVAVVLAAILVVAMLIASVAITNSHHSQGTPTRLTIDQIDPCSPHLLGSQLAPHEQMELEERCAQQERSIPAQ